MKNIITIITILFLTAVFAQAPQKMSYQSVVRNSTGELIVNSPIAVKISILQESNSGTAVFIETHAVSTNANGLVSLSIGEGIQQTGSFGAINWASGSYFIKTEIDPNGGSNYNISGTSELMSVPYALYAANSPAGATGPMGLTGAQGPIGLTGATGATGPAGAQGPIGLTGATGPAGSQGPIGLTGATGTAGATGAQGPIGPIGLTGSQGIPGTPGVPGSIGSQGPQGIPGPIGPQGDAGVAGATGAQGPIGLTGANGTAGATGAQGPIGPIGLTGANGTDGATGAQGAQGPIGPIGLTGANGTAGAAGAQGPIGPIGLTGANGTDGATGAQGPIGPIGLTGATGPAGATGAQGPIGLTGAPGQHGSLIVTNISSNGTTLSTANQFVYITGNFSLLLPSNPEIGQTLHIFSESVSSTINPNGKFFRDGGYNYSVSTFNEFGGTTSKGVILIYNGLYWFTF